MDTNGDENEEIDAAAVRKGRKAPRILVLCRRHFGNGAYKR